MSAGVVDGLNCRLRKWNLERCRRSCGVNRFPQPLRDLELCIVAVRDRQTADCEPVRESTWCGDALHGITLSFCQGRCEAGGQHLA